MALRGIRCIEIAGLAPAPFAGLCLADFGADVIRIDRVQGGRVAMNPDTSSRGKRSIALDLKSSHGKSVFKRLVKNSDVLIEPFRPGVMERLGLGPDVLCSENPKLVFARMTGFGQGGEELYEKAAGHDINYLALSGALSGLRAEGAPPQPPANLLGDFGGGGLICAFGIVLALMERHTSGKGQVVDAAMVDGAAFLAISMMNMNSLGAWSNELNEVGTNLLDGGAHFYGSYTCKDGKHMSVGAIEKQFYAALLEGLELSNEELPHQMDKDQWPMMKEKFTKIFLTKTRDEWTKIFDGKDACCVPVLSFAEAKSLPHNVKRGTFGPSVEDPATLEPNAAPKLSRTPAHPVRARAVPGKDSIEVLKEFGYAQTEIDELLKSKGVIDVGQAKL